MKYDPRGEDLPHEWIATTMLMPDKYSKEACSVHRRWKTEVMETFMTQKLDTMHSIPSLEPLLSRYLLRPIHGSIPLEQECTGTRVLTVYFRMLLIPANLEMLLISSLLEPYIRPHQSTLV
jgi:hypothetical protein